MKKLLYILFALFFISSYAQRGGRTSVIKKDRWIDYVLAESMENRIWTCNVSPDSSYTYYPYFRFRQHVNMGGTVGVGPLNIRTSILVADTVYRTRIQNFGSGQQVSAYIGPDSGVPYPEGLKKFKIRLPRWQSPRIGKVGFYYGNNVNCAPSNTTTTKIDISKLKNVTAVQSYPASDNLLKLSQLELGNNPIVYLEINRSAIDTLKLNNYPSLEYITSTNSTTKVIEMDTLYPNLTEIYFQNSSINHLFKVNAPALKTLDISNNPIGALDLSDNPDLRSLKAANCNLTELDLTNNTELRKLVLGNSNTNSNNFGSSGLIGLYGLNKLSTNLNLRACGIVMTDFDLNNFPNLISLSLERNNGITGKILMDTIHDNITSLNLRGVSSLTFEAEKFPNITDLRVFDHTSSSGIVFDLTKLKKLQTFYFSDCASGSEMTVYDLSYNENEIPTIYGVNNNSIEQLILPENYSVGSSTFSMRICDNLQKIVLPKVQVSNNVFNDGIYDCPNLSELENLNYIQRNNSNLYITNCGFSELDTSFGETSCFPNLTGLAIGGSNDTYTSTAVYEHRKNNLTTLIVLGSYFQVTGDIGTDFGASATLIHVIGNSDISYSKSGFFGSTMRRVYIRPTTGGLTTDGGQVANLIIDLSTKDWTTSNNVSINGSTYTYRVIDLRGNCATPTPSTALTDALNLLTTKGVTVLTN